MQNYKRVLTLLFALVLYSCLSIPSFAASVPEIKMHRGYVFSEGDFEGMIVTYNADGAPFVIDPNDDEYNTLAISVVTAKTIVDTWVSSDPRLNHNVFMIPAGRTIIVLQTHPTWGTVQIEYAGTTGWVNGSNLQL